MVDIADLGAVDDDVPFNHAIADGLITAFDGAASTIEGQAGSRSSYVATASNDFRGHFADLFGSNALVASADATELANRLREVATGALKLQEEARKEQQRRNKAREWKREHDNRNALEEFGDWLGGGDDPPVGPPAAQPTIPVSPPLNGTRQTPPPGSGGGGGSGTTSARPADLRTFATGSSGLNSLLAGRPGALRGQLSSFAAQCRWGTLDASGVLTGFDKWLTANADDVSWATTIADAFTRAGGENTISTVANSALVKELSRKHLGNTRQDLTIAGPQAFGHPPTTGYAEDPVNTATGNFVETETDLGFAGGADCLEFARTYNSADDADRQQDFGPGWSSILDQRLDLTDQHATLVQADGRRILFPRLGDGCDRAPGENLWLARTGDVAHRLEVSDNNGQRRTFSATGSWIATTRGTGTMISAVRDPAGRLTRVDSERGRSIMIERNPAGRIEAVRTDDGRTVEYGYDETGRLISATSATGTRHYRWNDDSLITAVIDADGVVEVENSYDDRRRIRSQRSPYGRTTRYLYLAGRTTVVSDQDGTRSNTWIADERGRLVGVVDADEYRQSMSYDRYGNLVAATERDGTATVHAYDDRGRLVRTVTPSGADLTYSYDDRDRVTTVVTETGAVTSFGYDGADSDGADGRNPSVITDPEGGRSKLHWQHGLLSRVVDPVGVTVDLDYGQHGDLIAITDALGNVARLERDAAGRVTAAVAPSGARTSYRYHDSGLLASRRDPDGAIWRYAYTDGGRPTAVIDPLGGRTELEYGPHGDAIAMTDPLDRTTSRILDDLGNVQELILPDGSSWRLAHDALSRLTETIAPTGHSWRRDYGSTGELVAVTDPTGVRSSMAIDPTRAEIVEADGRHAIRFDPLGRPVAVDSPDGSAELISYDRCGRPVELVDGEGGLTLLRRDAAGRIIEQLTPSGATTRYRYDACGRLAVLIDPLGAETMISYDVDGRPVRRVLPTGEVAWTDYDVMGRVIAQHEPGRGMANYSYDLLGRLVRSADSWCGRRRYRYDAAGQLVSVINGNGGLTRYGYDVNGRVESITDPLGGITRRAYDHLNQVIGQTDPLHRTTTAGYDGAGRQQWQTEPTGRRIGWTYDRAGREASALVDGRTIRTIRRDLPNRSMIIADHSDPHRSVEHELRWNRCGQLITHRRNADAVQWRYDADGRRTGLRTPNGAGIDYRWDVAGRLTVVDHPLLGPATFGHDASGRLVEAVADGVIQRWDHTDGFVTGHDLTTPDGATRTTIERDVWGRIVRIGDGTGDRHYGYDQAGQLIVERWADGRLCRRSFDPAGRLTAEAVGTLITSHRYDAGSQLIMTTINDGDDVDLDRISYRYDDLGRRTRSAHADGRSRDFDWSPTGELTGVTDHGYSDDDALTRRIRVDALGEVTDVDGSSIWWDTAAGAIAGPVQFGDRPVVAVDGLTGVGDGWLPTGWRPARATDPDAPWQADGGLTIAGVEWMNARAYDPDTRSFLSVDPYDPVPGAGWAGNPYAFAGNDPLHELDPTGLSPVTDAELKAYADSNNGALSAAGHWVQDNWEYVAGGAMVIAGGALMVTGVGGPAGMALVSAGADTIIQKATTGQVNWGQVAVSGALGAVGGGAASWAARASTNGVRALATRAAVYGGVSATGSEAVYLTKNHDQLTWQGALGAGAGGFVSGVVSAGAGPAGGTLARSLGQGAKSLAAKGYTAGISFAGGSSGSVVNNLVSGKPINWTGAAVSGTMSAGSSFIPKIISAKGTNTLSQLSYFGPRSLSGVLSAGATNTKALWAATAQGAVTSYSANMGNHWLFGG